MTRAIAASALAFCVILGRAEAQSIDDMEQVRFAVPVTEAKAPPWAETTKPDLVTVCFGYNDWTSGMRGPRFKETMAFAVDRIRRMTGAEVLLMTTCPAMERWTDMAELIQV